MNEATSAIVSLNSKKFLRKKYLNLRRKLSKEEVIERSNKIMQNLFQINEFRKANIIMFYAAFDNEVETKDMISKAIEGGKRVILPVMDKENKSLILREIKNFDNDTEKNKFGIPEPKRNYLQVNKNILDLIIIPGIVFDKRGYRIGFGQGYYDRFLKNVNKIKIGLSYSFQVIDKLPINKDDIKIDIIITDREIIRNV